MGQRQATRCRTGLVDSLARPGGNVTGRQTDAGSSTSQSWLVVMRRVAAGLTQALADGIGRVSIRPGQTSGPLHPLAQDRYAENNCVSELDRPCGLRRRADCGNARINPNSPERSPS